HSVLAGVPGACGGASDAAPLELGHGEVCDVGSGGRDLAHPLAGPRPLHGDHGPLAGDIGAADDVDHPLGVGGVGHDVEPLLAAPPHDQVVDHRAIGVVEQVGVLGPTRPDL